MPVPANIQSKPTITIYLKGFVGIMPASTKITFTGKLNVNLVIAFGLGNATLPGQNTVAGQQTYTEDSGPALALLQYTEVSSTGNNGVQTFSFDDVVSIGTLNMASTGSLSSCAFPALKSVVNMTFNTHVVLTSVSFPNLVSIGQQLLFQNFVLLTTCSFPKLVSIDAGMGFATMPLLTSLSLPELKYVNGGISPNGLNVLTAFSLPKLEYVGSTVSPSNMPLCTSFSLPNMVEYQNAITIPSATMANIDTLVLGTVGTLKRLNGNITASGLKISSAGINALLALLVSLDGTGGTTIWGAGKTINVSGGTNGAPTGQGITDKATLIARGATVTTN